MVGGEAGRTGVGPVVHDNADQLRRGVCFEVGWCVRREWGKLAGGAEHDVLGGEEDIGDVEGGLEEGACVAFAPLQAIRQKVLHCFEISSQLCFGWAVEARLTHRAVFLLDFGAPCVVAFLQLLVALE